MRGKALGLIETIGYLSAVEAADLCLKSANVTLVGLEKVTGGLVTIKVEGDVGAVKAAIDAAKVAVDRRGSLVSIHVIAGPAEELQSIITPQNKKVNTYEKVTATDKDSPEIEKIIETQKDDIQEDVLKEKTSVAEELTVKNKMSFTKEELVNMKVVDLRALARQLVGIEIDKNQIKFARKKQLVKAILDFYGGGEE